MASGESTRPSRLPVSVPPLLLVRHGRAGDRAKWTGADRDRPLDGRGRRQAQWLVEALAEFPIHRILSSPYVRCVQTVEPLAEARKLAVEVVEALAEGAGGQAAGRLLQELSGTCAALCTHGDVIAELVPGKPAKKGSVWVLDGADLRPLRYLAPAT
jgi:phosphohistidine phosphatase SixA